MSQEKIHDLVSYIFISTGTATAGIGLNYQMADFWVGFLVKLVSVGSFLVFLLINQDKIESNWKKFKNRFKSNK